MVIDPVM